MVIENATDDFSDSVFEAMVFPTVMNPGVCSPLVDKLTASGRGKSLVGNVLL